MVCTTLKVKGTRLWSMAINVAKIKEMSLRQQATLACQGKLLVLLQRKYQRYSRRNRQKVSPGQTRRHCCGNIMFATNVSLFVHPWKHRCGNKICFPGSKNGPTNKTFLLRKQCFLTCPYVFKCFQQEKHCFRD